MTDPFGEINKQALAVLRHPDKRSSWTGVVVARTDPRFHGIDPDEYVDTIAKHASELPQSIPLSCARLRGELWIRGAPPNPVIVDSGRCNFSQLAAPFALGDEPPIRIQIASDGSWFAVGAHHSAFDGSAVIDAIRILAGGSCPTHFYKGDIVRKSRGVAPTLRLSSLFPSKELKRMAFPADRAAASEHPPASEVFVSRELPLVRKDVAIRIPEAVLAEIAMFSALRGRPCFRFGLTMGLEGGRGASNVSTFRRVDIKVGEPMGDAIRRALRDPSDPWEVARPFRLMSYLGPVVDRLSDTVLVTNMGRFVMPKEIVGIEGYPIARGRSGVSVGVVRLSGAESTISMRCRDINQEDSEAILSSIVDRLVK